MDIKDVANYIETAGFDKLPPNVVAKAKMCTLDILGNSLAAQEAKSANCVRRAVRKMGGRGKSTLIGVGVKERWIYMVFAIATGDQDFRAELTTNSKNLIFQTTTSVPVLLYSSIAKLNTHCTRLS